MITNTIERQIHFEVIVEALAPSEKEIQKGREFRTQKMTREVLICYIQDTAPSVELRLGQDLKIQSLTVLM